MTLRRYLMHANDALLATLRELKSGQEVPDVSDFGCFHPTSLCLVNWSCTFQWNDPNFGNLNSANDCSFSSKTGFCFKLWKLHVSLSTFQSGSFFPLSTERKRRWKWDRLLILFTAKMKANFVFTFIARCKVQHRALSFVHLCTSRNRSFGLPKQRKSLLINYAQLKVCSPRCCHCAVWFGLKYHGYHARGFTMSPVKFQILRF